MPESLAFEEDAIWEESVNIRTKTHKPTHSLLNAITISTSDINITIWISATQSFIPTQLRKRSLQITAIERQLDQKANEVSQQVALVSELEEAVQRKVVEAQKVRQELQERVNETKALSEQLDTVKQWSKEQQRTLETQVDKVCAVH